MVEASELYVGTGLVWWMGTVYELTAMYLLGRRVVVLVLIIL